MNDHLRPWLRWSARIAACLVGLFLSLFALDAFGQGKTLVDALPDFAVHLAPVLVLLAIVAVSWRWEWLGALAFTGAAVWYASFARDHVSWVVAISTPLLVVGLLYFWSWLHDRILRGKAEARP